MRMRLAVAAVLLALGGCASPQEVVADKENLLAASGFVPRPANTEARAAMLRNLPPNRFTQRAQGDHFVYIYPDPLNCGCVYFGSADAYGRYRQAMLQRRLVNDQLLAAQLSSDARWDWGPWGPFGW